MSRAIRALAAALALVAFLALRRGTQEPQPWIDRRLVMGSLVTVTVVGQDEARAAAATRAAFARMEELDQVASGWREDGKVTALNRRGRLSRAEAGPELVAMLEGALKLARLSGGRFDPILGVLVDAWGFGPGGPADAVGPPGSLSAATPSAQAGRPPSPEALERARRASGVSLLRMGSDDLELSGGARVELGGYAAGYAVDRAIEILVAHGVAALVDHSGDLRATGPKPDGTPWRIGVRDPTGGPGSLLGVVRLSTGAITTSGDYEHTFEYGGQHYHHLLDPSTGLPGRLWSQVTVRAKTGTEADGWSKPLFLAPESEALALAARAGLEALWVAPDGRLVATPGWTHERLP